MKCPHCGYVDGWCPEEMKPILGKEGKFYKLSGHSMIREQQHTYRTESVMLVACPSCRKTFITDD